MQQNTKQLTRLSGIDDLKSMLASKYQKQIMSLFDDEKRGRRFISSIASSVQRVPKLLDCRADTLFNSFITMAELNLMPSDVSGEAYVLPYGAEAQFQIGYQGLVTLFYRAGAKQINAEIVYKNDDFSLVNGVIRHEPDIFSEDRGEAIGAYVIVTLATGGVVSKVMKKSDIIGIGKKFSKSYSTSFTPWKVQNDPELWMWKKTVLKQCAKLVPKSDVIVRAISEDNKDSVIEERKKRFEGITPPNEIKDAEVAKQEPESKPEEKKEVEVVPVDDDIPIIQVEEDSDAVKNAKEIFNKQK